MSKNPVILFKQSQPNSVIRLTLLVLLSAGLVMSMYTVVWAVNSGGAWAYSSSSGAWTRVDQGGTCLHVRTTDGAQRFIPGGTTAGWNSFINSAPSKQTDNCLSGSKRYGQCTGAGGTVVNAGGTIICRFNTSNGSCPSGWSQFDSWRQRLGSTCSGAQATYTYSCSCGKECTTTCTTSCSGASSCTPSSQGFINGGGVNSCTYTNETVSTYSCNCDKGGCETCTTCSTSNATCSSYSHYRVGCR